MRTPERPGACSPPIAAQGVPRATSCWARSRNWPGKLLCTKRTARGIRLFWGAPPGLSSIVALDAGSAPQARIGGRLVRAWASYRPHRVGERTQAGADGDAFQIEGRLFHA